jgi:hypothetical protein
MRIPFRASVAYAFCVCVAGCAAPQPPPITTISTQDARDAIIIGKSTKPDVIAVLGKATAVSFDSGFEVWVYRFAGGTPARPGQGGLFGSAGPEGRTPAKTEFVLLFAPSGVVTKARIRAAPQPTQK